jgi:hypothetical protein
MIAPRDHLRHDLTSLYSFVDSICDSCFNRPAASAHLAPTQRFFDYIVQLATATKLYLSSYSVEDDDDYDAKRQELEIVRKAWRELHQFVKAAVDANTLNVPTSLIEGLTRRVRQIKKFSATEFAFFHTYEFNYLQVEPSEVRSKIAEPLRSIIPTAGEFSPDLALIGIPYSQGSTLFLNSLVGHEIGHFVYRATTPTVLLLAEAEGALKHELKDQYAQMESGRQLLLKATVVKWAEELFCDLFAVALVGPCHTFCYVEAYDVLALLQSDGELSPERLKQRLRFYSSYPCHIFRIQQQAIFLKELGWWDTFKSVKSHHVLFLSKVLAIPKNAYGDEEDSVDRKACIAALFEMLPEVKRLVGSALDGLDPGVYEFKQLESRVRDYLRNGVVPSTLVFAESNKPVYPTPICVLNAGVMFYLSELDSFIESVPDEDVTSHERRLHWVRRLEQWLSKAIQDESLLRR